MRVDVRQFVCCLDVYHTFICENFIERVGALALTCFGFDILFVVLFLSIGVIGVAPKMEKWK